MRKGGENGCTMEERVREEREGGIEGEKKDMKVATVDRGEKGEGNLGEQGEGGREGLSEGGKAERR